MMMKTTNHDQNREGNGKGTQEGKERNAKSIKQKAMEEAMIMKIEKIS